MLRLFGNPILQIKEMRPNELKSYVGMYTFSTNISFSSLYFILQ